jgi:hypothetical protein
MRARPPALGGPSGQNRAHRIVQRPGLLRLVLPARGALFCVATEPKFTRVRLHWAGHTVSERVTTAWPGGSDPMIPMLFRGVPCRSLCGHRRRLRVGIWVRGGLPGAVMG